MAYDLTPYEPQGSDSGKTGFLTRVVGGFRYITTALNALLTLFTGHTHTAGTGVVAITICTSSTHPATANLGELVIETDTGRIKRCTNATGPVFTDIGQIHVCTSSTHPADPVDGLTIYETDLDSFKVYNGSAWVALADPLTFFSVLTAGGTADALTITPSPAISAYATGQWFWVKIASDNSGPATLNVNAKGATAIKLVTGAALSAKNLTAGQVALFWYDGTNFVLVNPYLLTSTTPSALGTAAVGTATTAARADHAHASPSTALDSSTASLSFSGNQSSQLVDLSSVIPAGAKRAKLLVTCDNYDRVRAFTKAYGATNWQDAGWSGDPAVSFAPALDLLSPVSSDRKITVTIQAGGGAFTNGKLIVTGYEL